MTSVGYGNIVASTHLGRACAVFAIINGALLLALLVGLILGWFELEEKKKQTINYIKESTLAISFVKASLEYNAARKKRQRFLRHEMKDWEKDLYVPSMEDCAVLKLRMEQASDAFSKARKDNRASDENAERDKMIQQIQDRLLDLSDKFDRFISSQLEAGTLVINDNFNPLMLSLSQSSRQTEKDK
jgi:hypothetical protein